MQMTVMGPSVFGNTGITGGGMGLTRRRNNRPDTPEEIEADRLARGGAPGYAPDMAPGGTASGQAGTNIFNQPQQFPGENFGSNDVDRAGTFFSNWLFNQLGPFTGLAPNVADAYRSILSGGTPASLSGMGDYLKGQVRSSQEELQNLMAPMLARGVSAINAQVPTQWRQAEDQLPRALANEAKMGVGDSVIKGIADLYGNAQNNLYSSTANMQGNLFNTLSGAYGGLLQNALSAGGPGQLIQGGLAAFDPVKALGTFDLQQYSIDQARKAGQKK